MSELIDRQAALDALDKRFDNIPMEQTAEILMLRKDLRELPTIQPEVLACGNGELVVQPEPQWIPVSERLPEAEEFVLASLTGKYRNITFEHACEIADYADGEWCVYAYPHMSAEKCEELIEAWMPLPEAYKPTK
jgi:hypothetical protein